MAAASVDVLRRHAGATGGPVDAWCVMHEYVLNDPVRSGLVERWCDDRFSASSVFGPADAGGGQAPALQRNLG